MADQHNADIPAMANQIANDIPDIKENLEFHKDCFEGICTGWSNTDATALHVNDLAETVVRNSITTTYAVTTVVATSPVAITGLTAGGLYKVIFYLSGANFYLQLRFNNDSNAKYVFTRHHTGRETATPMHDYAASAALDTKILLSTSSAHDFIIGELIFHSYNSAATNDAVVGKFETMGYGDIDNFLSNVGSFRMLTNDTAAVTEIDFIASSGNLTGTILVQRLV